MSENYYDLLGIPKDSNPDVIKAAYRREALKWHPDHNGGSAAAAEHFKRIGQAFAVLSNASSRAAYDATLNQGQPRSTEEYAKEGAYYWNEREWAPGNESWRTTFRRPQFGIGGIVLVIIIIINILGAIFPNGL